MLRAYMLLVIIYVECIYVGGEFFYVLLVVKLLVYACNGMCLVWTCDITWSMSY